MSDRIWRGARMSEHPSISYPSSQDMTPLPWAGILDRVSQSLGPELSQQLSALALPPLHRVKQRFPRECVTEVEAHLRRELEQPAFRARIPAGGRVAITAG